MIKNLTIENFKGFKKLELPILKQITLLAGKNHIGKSTVLEAIMLLNNPSLSPQILPNIVNRENIMAMVPKFDIAIHGLFYNFDTSKSVGIISDSLFMNVEYNDNCKYEVSGVGGQPDIKTEMVSSGIEFTYKDAVKEVIFTAKSIRHTIINDMYLGNVEQKIYKTLADVVTNTILIDEFGSIYRNNNYYNAAPPAMQNIPLNMQRLDASVIEFENIRNDQIKKDALIKALNIIDADIIDVEYGNKTSVNQFNKMTIEVRKKNLSKTLALSVLGQGIKKIFNIVCGIVSNQDGILLIDELENGLHFSIMPHVWEIIYELSKKYNCQLIITTHSLELVKYAVLIEKFSEHDFTFIKLFDNAGTISAYSYSQLQDSAESELDVR